MLVRCGGGCCVAAALVVPAGASLAGDGPVVAMAKECAVCGLTLVASMMCWGFEGCGVCVGELKARDNCGLMYLWSGARSGKDCGLFMSWTRH